MDGISWLLKSLNLPIDEIMAAGQRLIRIAEECKAQMDRIESRLTNIERRMSAIEGNTLPDGDWDGRAPLAINGHVPNE